MMVCAAADKSGVAVCRGTLALRHKAGMLGRQHGGQREEKEVMKRRVRSHAHRSPHACAKSMLQCSNRDIMKVKRQCSAPKTRNLIQNSIDICNKAKTSAMERHVT